MNDLKTIQFTHRDLLLTFNLNSNKDVSGIFVGASKTPVNPMSRDYVTYGTILKNKLGDLIDRL